MHAVASDRTVVMDTAFPLIAVSLSNGQTFDHLMSLEQVVIGRARECDLVLEDLGVSRKHARIFCVNGQWNIEDLQSSNGILINGRKTRSAVLNNADEIVLGNARLVFSQPEAADGGEDRTVIQKARGASPAGKGVLQTKRPSVGRRFGKIPRLVLLSLTVGGILILVVSMFGGKDQEVIHDPVSTIETLPPALPAEQPLPDNVVSYPAVAVPESKQAAPDALQASRHAETAQVYYDAGRLPDAIVEWSHALALDPGNEVYSIKLEQAINQVTSRAEEAYRRGVRNYQFLNYEEALRDWNHVLHLIPDASHPLHQNALRNMEQARSQMKR